MNIAIQNISKSYGRQVVLDDLSFSAGPGRCIGILGENGSGKSTLFSILTGLQKGTGAFFCDGVDLLKNTKLRMKTVGFVPQNPPLIPELTAYDTLLLWYSRDQMLAELNAGKLKMLGIDEFLKVPVSKMSGGMKKRLAIGCAIAHDPQILLLDEPSSALDLVCREQIYAYLRSFTRRGGITLLATHEIYELGFCDDVYLLKGGRLSRYEGDRQLDELIGQLKNA